MNRRKLPASKSGAEALIHRCEHEGCNAWGYFGFGVNLLKREPGRWFCWEHRNEGEAQEARAA